MTDFLVAGWTARLGGDLGDLGVGGSGALFLGVLGLLLRPTCLTSEVELALAGSDWA